MVPPRSALALGFVFFALLAAAETPPWAHEASDLTPDPTVRWGRLDNGVRYAIGASTDPTGRASLRLLVLAGTVHETDGQRGYAHFVEHLAFGGTRRFPGQSLHATLQRQGIARGPDINAYTHADRTVYRLDLPASEPERVRTGLTVLREFADGLSFGPAEVERERTVILIEKAMRHTASERAENALQRFLFPGSPLAETNGYGTEASIRGASAEGLRQFYTTWYRADNLVVVATGAFEPAAVAREIEAQFGSMSPPATPRPVLQPGPIANPPALRVGTAPPATAGGAVRFTLAALHPVPLIDTRANLAEALRRSLAFDVFNRRLDELQRAAPEEIALASAVLQNGPFYQQALIRLHCRREHWPRALAALGRELRRVQEHGFTAGEIAESRAKVTALLAYAARAEATRLAEFQADALVESIAESRVYLAPAELTRLSAALLAEATPADCLAAFRAAWSPGEPQLFATGNFDRADIVDELAAVYRRSARKRTRPPAEPPPLAFAYGDFGAPGRIVEHRYLADLDLHCLRFANGVRLNLKPTRFEANRIVYGARLGDGAAGEPPRSPGLRYFADASLGSLGLGRHDPRALGRLAAGHLATLSFATGEDAFYVSGISDTVNAERLLQLLTAHLTDPGWRRSEGPAVQQRMFSRIDELNRNPAAFLSGQRHGRLAGGDGRYALPAAAQLARYSIADVRAWVAPQLARAPLELGIVGDFDVEEMIHLARRTIGCLPPREPLVPPRPVTFAAQLPPTTVTPATDNPHGAIQLAWAVPGPDQLRREYQLELLGEVVRNRLISHLRGELGATYSASCLLWRSELQRDTAYLIASFNCQPGDTGRVAAAAQAQIAALVRDGVTAEEFERARQPRLQNAPSQLRSNAHWLANFVAAAQSRPEQLDGARQRVALLQQITAAELTALAAEILPASRTSLFTAHPAE